MKSRSGLSVASRSGFGISVHGNQDYLGARKDKNRQFLKADNFGVRKVVKRSNFPVESQQIMPKLMQKNGRKAQQIDVMTPSIKSPQKTIGESSPEFEARSIDSPQFTIKENAYKQSQDLLQRRSVK